MKDNGTESPDANRAENARVEYSAAQDAYLHYDNFAWQVGGVLIAGVFVYWGFIISTPPGLLPVVIGNLLVCLLMSIWLIYAEHNRQIYLYKLHRIHELEFELGMYQHRRFKEWPSQKRVYILYGPGGHYLNDGIYGLVSLGGLFPTLFGKTGNEWQWCWYHFALIFLNFLIVVLVICQVNCMDHKAREAIQNLERNSSMYKSPNN